MLPVRTKLSYGVGGICDNTLYTLTGTYLLLYLTTVAGVSPAIAGTISAVGSIWESLIGPIIGFKSDETITRFGRRKPYMLIAAFPVAVVTSLLFTTIDAGPLFKAIYYGLMIVLFWTFFAMEFVPYLSWGADLTEDYNERTVLRSYAYIFNQVGMLIGMVLPNIIVDYAMNMGKSTAQSWQIVGMFCGVCAGLALVLCTTTIHNNDISSDAVRALKEKRIAENGGVKPKFLDLREIPKMFRSYGNIIKLKPILALIGASMFYLIANTIFSSDRVFYMTYNLGMSQTSVSLFMFIITISGALFVPFVAKTAEKTDKKTAFMYGIGVSGVLMIIMYFLPVGVSKAATAEMLSQYEAAGVATSGMSPMIYCIIACLLYSVANTCYWQLMPSMIYDICEVDELKSGESHSGAVISLQALSESVCIAIGLQAIGIALDVANFDETASAVEGLSGLVSQCQPLSALNAVSAMFTLVPGIFMVLTFFIMTKYPISKDMFNRILAKLEKRRAGEEVDISEFDELF